MSITRKFIGRVLAAGAGAVLIAAAPAAVMAAGVPTTTSNQIVLADPGGSGSGDAGGGGGCYNGVCGGWNPGQGGYGHGCYNGVCGGWDGQRGWGNCAALPHELVRQRPKSLRQRVIGVSASRSGAEQVIRQDDLVNPLLGPRCHLLCDAFRGAVQHRNR